MLLSSSLCSQPPSGGLCVVGSLGNSAESSEDESADINFLSRPIPEFVILPRKCRPPDRRFLPVPGTIRRMRLWIAGNGKFTYTGPGRQQFRHKCCVNQLSQPNCGTASLRFLIRSTSLSPGHQHTPRRASTTRPGSSRSLANAALVFR